MTIRMSQANLLAVLDSEAKERGASGSPN